MHIQYLPWKSRLTPWLQFMFFIAKFLLQYIYSFSVVTNLGYEKIPSNFLRWKERSDKESIFKNIIYTMMPFKLFSGKAFLLQKMLKYRISKYESTPPPPSRFLRKFKKNESSCVIRTTCLVVCWKIIRNPGEKFKWINKM